MAPSLAGCSAARAATATPLSASEFMSIPAERPSSPFTARERDLIRHEMGMHFGQFPRLADGIFLRTWRAGEQKGQPKIPLAVRSMLDRGWSRSGQAQWVAPSSPKPGWPRCASSRRPARDGADALRPSPARTRSGRS